MRSPIASPRTWDRPKATPEASVRGTQSAGSPARFAAPRPLATLVVLAGLGYLADSIGTVFVAGYVPTISTFTFVGEALLIVWLFWRAARASADETVVAPATQTVAVAS